MMTLHPDLARVMGVARWGQQVFEVVVVDQATVDIVCLTNGQPDLTIADETGGIYGLAAAQVLATAKIMGVHIEWGPGDETDDGWRRFQLSPRVYPQVERP